MPASGRLCGWSPRRGWEGTSGGSQSCLGSSEPAAGGATLLRREGELRRVGASQLARGCSRGRGRGRVRRRKEDVDKEGEGRRASSQQQQPAQSTSGGCDLTLTSFHTRLRQMFLHRYFKKVISWCVMKVWSPM